MAYQFVPLHGWRVLAADIALPQPVLTDDVRDIEKMEFVGNVGLVDQGTHPAAPLHSVCWRTASQMSCQSVSGPWRPSLCH